MCRCITIQIYIYTDTHIIHTYTDTHTYTWIHYIHTIPYRCSSHLAGKPGDFHLGTGRGETTAQCHAGAQRRSVPATGSPDVGETNVVRKCDFIVI